MSVRLSKASRRRIRDVVKHFGNGTTPHNYVITAVLAQLERDEAKVRRTQVKRAPANPRKAHR
jgi:hypothetical protein